jgi:catechol 2,3-dioxygenase-like lactoylglutathione lyase family enzyme
MVRQTPDVEVLKPLPAGVRDMSDLTAHHYGVTVSDLDRCVTFYRDVLGLEVLAEFSVGGDAFETGVGIEGASAEFAHLDAGDARIELVSYEPAGEDRPDPRLDQSGATHVGLGVDDVEAFYESLPEDVATISPPRTTESGTTILFVEDPEGNLIEILDA